MGCGHASERCAQEKIVPDCLSQRTLIGISNISREIGVVVFLSTSNGNGKGNSNSL